MLCVSKNIVGATKHLLINDNNDLSFVNEPPQDVYFYDENFAKTKCLRTLFSLEKKQFTAQIPEQYKKAYSQLTKNSDNKIPPWFRCIPQSQYKAFLDNAKNEITNQFQKCNVQYYENTFSKHTIVFDSLQPSKISFDAIKSHSKSEQSSPEAVLNTFMPSRDGVTSPIVYDRLGSRTGRLKIASGPNIMTLKKEFRNVLCSRFIGGKILSIDYSALEARIMLYSVGRATSNGDLYELIVNEVFDGKLTRNQVKVAVLSLIFGSGEAYIAHSLGIERVEARRISKEIRKYFCVSILEKKLIESMVDGHIRNHYGRLVEVPENNLIVNSFIQSTGVDVALHGFTKIVEFISSIKSKIKPVPLFIQTDAIILDIPPEFTDLPILLKAAESIPGFVQRFPVHVDLFAK
jgi:hypothetical protein